MEHGLWTPVPLAPPKKLDNFILHLKEVDPLAQDRIAGDGRLSWHMTGCTGDYSAHTPQWAVAQAMAGQIHDPGTGGAAEARAVRASFLYHLGDIIYKPDADSDAGSPDTDAPDASSPDRGQMYNDQFYAPYTMYGRPIFAVAGNHDGKYAPHQRHSAIDHFLLNFCSADGKRSADNTTDNRPAMTQPYVYWRLETPLVVILGLYSNIANGGLLDDPAQPEQQLQLAWLVQQLRDVRQQAEAASTRPPKAVCVAVHYPPYSGATNFSQRGDPTLGPTHATGARPLAEQLQQAFSASGQRPDAVFSAHAHLYQRLTYTYADGWEVPYLIAGSGGHGPVERLWTACDGTEAQPRTVPFDAVLPSGLALPRGDRVQVEAYDDQSYGFLRLTTDGYVLTGEFFAAYPGTVALADRFTVDVRAHRIIRRE